MNKYQFMTELNKMMAERDAERPREDRLNEAFEKVTDALNTMAVEDCLAVLAATTCAILNTMPEKSWPIIRDTYNNMLDDALKFSQDEGTVQ